MKRYLITALLITLPAIIIWRGFVLSVLWAWFAVPAFDLPVISIPAAIGVITIVTMTRTPTIEESTGEWVRHLLLQFSYPSFLLGIGFITKLFM